MKFTKIIFLFFMSILLIFKVYAYDVVKTEFTNQPFIDTTSTINPQGINTINESLNYYTNKNKQPFKILMIESTGGEDINKVATNLFNYYEFGSEENNNAIFILISKGDRKFRLKVGKDLDGKFNQEMVTEYITPCAKNYFPSENYNNGVKCMITNSEIVMNQINNPSFIDLAINEYPFLCALLLLILILLGIFLIAYFGSRGGSSYSSSYYDSGYSSRDSGGSSSSSSGGGGSW